MPEWAWWLLVVAAALVALDQLGRWAERRGWIHWRKRGRAMGAGILDGMTEAFQPNQIHYIQEIKRDKKRSAAHGQGGQDETADSDERTGP